MLEKSIKERLEPFCISIQPSSVMLAQDMKRLKVVCEAPSVEHHVMRTFAPSLGRKDERLGILDI